MTDLSDDETLRHQISDLLISHSLAFHTAVQTGSEAAKPSETTAAILAAVRAHDVAHPEPWVIDLVKSYDNWRCSDDHAHHVAICLAVPEPVRSAAGIPS